MPKPIKLADGLRLIDYRTIKRPNQKSMFFGEVRNDAKDIYDSPDFIQTFLDADGNIIGENRVYSAVGFMRSKGTDFLVGPVSGFDPYKEAWQELHVSLLRADSWPAQIQIQYTYDPGLVLDRIVEESVEEESYTATVDGINKTDHDITGGTLISAFRDSQNRFCGYVRSDLDSTIPVGKKVRFRVSVERQSSDRYNPFTYLNDGEAFTVETLVRGRAYS